MQNYVYTPLGDLLFNIYNHTNDIGWSIVAITLIVKICLLPLNIKAALDGEKTQRILKKLKPKQDKIKELHKGDKMKEALAMQELYKSENFNPLSGLLSLFILILQMPIIFGLYHVINQKLVGDINHIAFGLFDITHKYIWMGLLSGLTMYILGNVTTKAQNIESTNEMQAAMMSSMKMSMVYTLPIMMGIFGGFVLQSGIGIYLVTSNIFGLVQFYITNYFKKRIV